MSPKVLETWINETLQDAEHLDIPGVILKPEHQIKGLEAGEVIQTILREVPVPTV